MYIFVCRWVRLCTELKVWSLAVLSVTPGFFPEYFLSDLQWMRWRCGYILSNSHLHVHEYAFLATRARPIYSQLKRGKRTLGPMHYYAVFKQNTHVKGYACIYGDHGFSLKNSLNPLKPADWAGRKWVQPICFFKRFDLFIFREGKWEERKRGRETSVCGCLSHTPYWEPGLPPRRVL